MTRKAYSNYEMRWRAVRAVRRGQAPQSVAKAYQVHRTTLYRWRIRHQENPRKGLQRQAGSGRPRRMDEIEAWLLRELVKQPASHYGHETDFWTCRRLMQLVRKEFQLLISQPTMWRTLRKWGLTYQRPERDYFEGVNALRRKWQHEVLPQIRRTTRKYRAILYFEDESSLSLTAILGKTWAPKGQTPVQKVTGKRGAIAAMSALSGKGDLLFTLHDRRIASAEVIHFLRQLLRHHPRRHLVVVMDQAPPHVSEATKDFIARQKRLHVFHFPKYSPKYNPDEYVWHHLKHEALKSHQATSKAELKTLAKRKLQKMAQNPHLLQGLFYRCCIADLLN